MTNNLEEAVKNLQDAINEAKKDPTCERFIGFGKRILECVSENDYDEAIFVTKTFKDATINFYRGEPTTQMLKYIDATINLIGNLR